MRLGQLRPVAGIGVKAVLLIALAPRIKDPATGHHVDRRALVRLGQQADHDRCRRLAVADHAYVLGDLVWQRPFGQPVTAPVEHPRVLLRLAGDADRRARAGEHDAVRPDRLSLLQRQPPPPVDGLHAGHLTGDDFSLRLLGDFTQVGAPLPVRRTQPAAINPVGIGAVRDQVPLPAIVRHRRGDRGRGRPPAVGVREADILLRRGAQGQQAAGVPLPPAPVPGHGAALDEHHPRGGQASGRDGARLGGDRDSLRPRAYNSQRRHDGEDNLTPRFRRPRYRRRPELRGVEENARLLEEYQTAG